MPKMVPESPLDRLRWLVDGKPTPIQFEDLGGSFRPQFRFTALLPASALPASEAKRIETYFDAMFEALVPVRDLITAYSLTGVMSRAPTSDFSLEVQFSDPQVIDMVRRSLPAELGGSALAHQRRHGNTLINRAEAHMFFRDKSPQEDPNRTNSDLSPVQEAGRMLESSTHQSSFGLVETAASAREPVLQLVDTPPRAAPIQSPEPKRKKMVVAEGITIKGGDILGCTHLAIEGQAYLTIDRCEKLEILENGIFTGSASVAEAEISGYCKGTLVVRDTLRITRTGHVVGSIQYGRLQVEEGGQIEGEMKLPLKGNEAEPQTKSDNPRWVDANAKVSA